MAKKTIIISIIIILAIAISLLFIFNPFKSQEQKICDSGGGDWKQFPNGCVDSCSSKGEDIFCTQVLTMGCDCGEGNCWDGISCV